MKLQTNIWRHPIPFMRGKFSIKMPRGSVILDYQALNNKLCLWEEHSIEEESTQDKRQFILRWTGIPFDPGSGYHTVHIGTVSLFLIVYHLFEIKEYVDFGPDFHPEIVS